MEAVKREDTHHMLVTPGYIRWVETGLGEEINMDQVLQVTVTTVVMHVWSDKSYNFI